MTEAPEATTKAGAVYSLKGTLLEACSCGVLCPCWIGEDPDGGVLRSGRLPLRPGQIHGVDVSGLSLLSVAHIPGNVLAGNWEVVVLVDDRAADDQREAILAALRASSEARSPTSPN
jgi:hypothetical protein